MATTVRIDPASKKVLLEFSWDDNGAPQVQTSAAAKEVPAKKEQKKVEAPAKVEQKEYTLEEVAKHNKDDDVWVVVNGVVLDCTKFLPER